MSLSQLKEQINDLEERLFVRPNDPALPLDKSKLKSQLKAISESLSHLQSMKPQDQSLSLEEVSAKKQSLINESASLSDQLLASKSDLQTLQSIVKSLLKADQKES